MILAHVVLTGGRWVQFALESDQADIIRATEGGTFKIPFPEEPRPLRDFITYLGSSAPAIVINIPETSSTTTEIPESSFENIEYK